MNKIFHISFFSCMSLIFLFAAPSSYADSNQRFVGSYFCIADAVGGVRFNDTARAWESYRFRASGRYILNISENVEVVERNSNNLRQTYFVNFSEHGSSGDNFTDKCFTRSAQLRGVNSLANFISDTGFLACDFTYGGLQVNLENGRFLSYYLAGYVDGVDGEGSDTPSIEIGVCSKLN